MPDLIEIRLCALVMIGVCPDGTKELIAIEDGDRESAESWATLLRGLKRRGMRAPVLAVGGGTSRGCSRSSTSQRSTGCICGRGT
jgi:transposase-like protein